MIRMTAMGITVVSNRQLFDFERRPSSQRRLWCAWYNTRTRILGPYQTKEE
jgi:hypothetical protein